MKILVFSDSHGNADAMQHALAAHPDAAAVIHLGDGASEASRLAADDKRPWHIVRGNCDIGGDHPQKARITIGGKRLYLTHGAVERVKYGLLNLGCAAEEAEVDAALYGHTHIADFNYHHGILLFNPGSIGTGSYGVLTIEKGAITPSFYRA